MSRRDPTWPLPDRPDHPAYLELLAELEGGAPEDSYHLFRDACLNDFWFFARHCLSLGTLICRDPHNSHYGKRWLDHRWLFERCREIQAEPDGHLDLWPRYHFKTALVTQSLSLWDLIDNPELRILIITNKLDTTGQGFISIPKRECETNERMVAHFPEVFWNDPKREALAAGCEWNDTAFTLRRQSNAREPSLMVCGLIANLPTSYHFDIRVWDDIVVEKNGLNKEQIEVTNEAFRKATGLAAEYTRDRMVGTHWGPNDSYRFILDLGAAKLRHHDVIDDAGEPVLHSKRFLEDFRQRLGSFHFSAQMRNQPLAENAQTFALEWANDNRYPERPHEIRAKLNVVILLDSASTKKTSSDFTVAAVVGIGRGLPLPHFFLLDLVRDRLGLVETTDLLFGLVEQWNPLCTFEEQFGAQRDIEHFKFVMTERGVRFRVRPMKEPVPKEERIRRLQPIFEAGRFHLPMELPRITEGRRRDMVEVLLEEEYKDWTPEGGSRHDDMLDCLAWTASPVLAKYLKPPRAPRADGGDPKQADYLQRAQLEQRRRGGSSTGMRSAWAW